MSPRTCNAKSKRTGKPCRARHVCASCGVCRMHGCNCSNPGGAPKGNKNALKHGIYSSVVDDELRDLMDQASPEPDPDDEVRLFRAMLARGLAWAKANPKRVENHPAAFAAAVEHAWRNLRQALQLKAQLAAQQGDKQAALDVRLVWDDVARQAQELADVGHRLEGVKSLDDLVDAEATE